jgi:hypothetical protein
MLRSNPSAGRTPNGRPPCKSRGRGWLSHLTHPFGAKAENLFRNPKMAWSVPWNLIGLQVSGDVGGFTIYTDRHGRKVVFPKAPPEKPPTQRQLQQRSRFRAAQRSWAALSLDDKAKLEEMTKKASAPMTGQNLWIHSALTADNPAIETLEAQTGITVPKPEFIP